MFTDNGVLPEDVKEIIPFLAKNFDIEKFIFEELSVSRQDTPDMPKQN